MARSTRQSAIISLIFLMLPICAVVAVAIAAHDVYVSVGDSGKRFCGSAYDVALIKKNGDMGGEWPGNQAAIDRACVAKSHKVMAVAAVPTIAFLVLIGLGAWQVRAGHRRAESARLGP